MKKIGFIITCHWSDEIRPNGNELLSNFAESLKNLNYPYNLYIVDNQSEHKLTIPSNATKYIRIDNQYETGLTGAWNTGIFAAYNDGCDILINCNDDLWFNETINNFVEYINNDYDKNIVYSALTDGSLGGPHLSSGPGTGIKKLSCGIDNDVINGFFFAFTKEHYELYRYSESEYFPINHEHNGGDGKWGGQEGYWIIKHKDGLFGIIICETFIPHTKYRAWRVGKRIDESLKLNK